MKTATCRQIIRRISRIRLHSYAVGKSSLQNRGVSRRRASRSVTRDNAQLPMLSHNGALLQPVNDHTSCHWPAAAQLAEHGQHVGHHSMLGNHGHCPANDNVKIGLNKVCSR